MNNINDIDIKSCTGCGVCSLNCPKNAIDIKLSESGFFVANVNQSLCVSCGKCKTVCYKFFNDFSEEDDSFNINNTKAYLSYSKEYNTRYKSSSGGIGSEIAKYGLENNYLVCGVKYNYKLNRAEHMITNNFADIELITGSKYIQSYTHHAFKSLDKEKKYIIFGTPCQIYGLKKYMLSNNINNMILVDFFCHGIPSYSLWKKYIDYISEKFYISKIKSLNFRNKTFGWHNYCMKIEDEHKKYISKRDNDKFLRFFLGNFCLNESCYNCKLRFNKVYSDIRLGDFWGPICKEDEIGSSIVLGNSQSGLQILKDLKKDRIYLREINFKELRSSQGMLHIDKPINYDKFNRELSTNISLQALYYRHLLKSDIKKVVTRHVPQNLKLYIKSKVIKN